MSRLQWWNYYVLQWFCFRIARDVRQSRQQILTLSWGLIFVWPLTCWGNPYKPTYPKYHRLWYTERGKSELGTYKVKQEKKK